MTRNSVTVKPYSMVTVSTVEHSQSEYEYEEQKSKILALPYTDDFEYKDYPKDYLSSRGNAPRYTTDEGGALLLTAGGVGTAAIIKRKRKK